MNSWWAGECPEESRMKTLRYGALTAVHVIAFLTQAQFAKTKVEDHDSARERLIGAWHLVRIAAPGPDGKPLDIPQPKGMLIYTRDGHMSVQLMYSPPNAQSNEYVQDGYEASFGSYDIDEATHTLTHHVEGSVTRDLLVGKDLPRIYQITDDGHLILRSARADEHWSVTWEHY
jgi:hypothetical protein